MSSSAAPDVRQPLLASRLVQLRVWRTCCGLTPSEKSDVLLSEQNSLNSAFHTSLRHGPAGVWLTGRPLQRRRDGGGAESKPFLSVALLCHFLRVGRAESLRHWEEQLESSAALGLGEHRPQRQSHLEAICCFQC